MTTRPEDQPSFDPKRQPAPPPHLQRPSLILDSGNPQADQLVARLLEFRIYAPNPDGCWHWQGSRQRQHGLPFMRDEQGNYTRVADYLYRYYGGELPDGAHTQAACETLYCIRPAHQRATAPKERSRYAGQYEPGGVVKPAAKAADPVQSQQQFRAALMRLGFGADQIDAFERGELDADALMKALR